MKTLAEQRAQQVHTSALVQKCFCSGNKAARRMGMSQVKMLLYVARGIKRESGSSNKKHHNLTSSSV